MRRFSAGFNQHNKSALFCNTARSFHGMPQEFRISGRYTSVESLFFHDRLAYRMRFTNGVLTVSGRVVALPEGLRNAGSYILELYNDAVLLNGIDITARIINDHSNSFSRSLR